MPESDRLAPGVAFRGAPDYRPAADAEQLPVRRAQMAMLAAHLTPRDVWIAAMVHEHRVLTTTQIADMGFGSVRTARRRLVALTGLRLVDRFRPLVALGAGTAPEHYVLGPAGAVWLAATYDLSAKAFGYHRNRAHLIAASQKLGHAVGCNQVFTDIAIAGRPGGQHGRLAAWWSERRCIRLFADAGVRPDGYGHHTLAEQGQDPDTAANVRFFLEYDTGTEPIAKVAAKLAGYARLAAASTPTPVLFHLPTAAREARLHTAIQAASRTVPVATTTPEARLIAASGPAGPVWLPVGAGRRRAVARLTLVELDRLVEDRPRPRRQGASIVPSWWNEPPTPLPPTAWLG
jgi:hypothetical protein